LSSKFFTTFRMLLNQWIEEGVRRTNVSVIVDASPNSFGNLNSKLIKYTQLRRQIYFKMSSVGLPKFWQDSLAWTCCWGRRMILNNLKYTADMAINTKQYKNISYNLSQIAVNIFTLYWLTHGYLSFTKAT